MVDKKLLEILACPQCKKEIQLSQTGDEIICVSCQLGYPIRDEIPVMLVEEARKLES